MEDLKSRFGVGVRDIPLCNTFTLSKRFCHGFLFVEWVLYSSCFFSLV